MNLIYQFYGVEPISEDPVEIKRKSIHEPIPANAVNGDLDTFVAYNRFSRPVFDPNVQFALKSPKVDSFDQERGFNNNNNNTTGLGMQRQGEKFQLGRVQRNSTQVPGWVP